MPSVNLIAELPASISPEEHKNLVASTPNSFQDIPPVLKHREENVSITLDPPLEGFSAEDPVQGTLYVLTSVLVFMSNTMHGFQIEYPAITLHAVSRGERGPSIYCQLDESNKGEGAGAVPSPEEGDAEMRELTIVPQNPASVESIFEALSDCAALHPDQETNSDDDDAFIDSSTFETFTGDESQELSEVGRAALAHLESIIYDPHDLLSASQQNGVHLEGEATSSHDGQEKTGTGDGQGAKD